MVRIACLQQATAIPPLTKVRGLSPNCHGKTRLLLHDNGALVRQNHGRK